MRLNTSTVTDTHIKGFFGEYRFLSNFHECTITIDGITYPSAEHAYMAYKTNDIEIKKKISRLPVPAAARKYGQTIELRKDWDQFKTAAMLHVLTIKFQNLLLAKQLMGTFPKQLEETNGWGDKFWGVCDGEGKGMLGTLLMMVRDNLMLRFAPDKYYEYYEANPKAVVFAKEYIPEEQAKVEQLNLFDILGNEV